MMDIRRPETPGEGLVPIEGLAGRLGGVERGAESINGVEAACINGC